jgi:hypothetical protein
MQRIVFFLSLFLQFFIAFADENQTENHIHSTTKEVGYPKPGESPDFKNIPELEHYFRLGIAECEIENCKKEIVCLNELKTIIRKSIQNLYRTKTYKITMLLMEIDDSRDTCEKELAKEANRTNFFAGKSQTKNPSYSPLAINTQEPTQTPTPIKESVEKHKPLLPPQTTHLKGFY